MIRYRRASRDKKRKGIDYTFKDFTWRDKKELKLGTGRVMATAEFLISNTGTMKELKENVDTVIKLINRQR
jgi:dephospho-CoA kinase